MVTTVAIAFAFTACGSATPASNSQPAASGADPPPFATDIEIDEPQPGDEEIDDDLPEHEEEIEASRRNAARADLRIELLDAPAAAEAGTELAVLVAVTSIDDDFVNAPTIVARLPEGLSTGTSDRCEEVGPDELHCQVALSILSDTGAVPVTSDPFELLLRVDDAAIPGPLVIELWVESLDNPITNDPNPADNAAVVELVIG